MKPLSIPMAILAVGSLCAQEPPPNFNARVILFGEAIQTSAILLGQGVKDQASNQTGPGIRLMGRLASESHWCAEEESHWYWELAGRFPSSAPMTTNRDISPIPPPNVLDVTKTKIYYSYWSAGVGYLIPLGRIADVGAHLEVRGETINPKGEYSTTSGGTGFVDAHTVYTRPWARLSLNLKIKARSSYILIGGDAGVAAVKTKQRTIQPMSQLNTLTLRALAPTWSGSVFAGVQF